MKHLELKNLLIFCAVLECSSAVPFPAMAATPAGNLEGADESSIYGWVWDSDNYNHIIPVEICIYPSKSPEVLKIDTIKADDYQEKLQQSIGDGYHGFEYSIDWSQFQQTDLRITAYAVTETERVFLGELTYHNETAHTVSADHETADTPSSQMPSEQELSSSSRVNQQVSSVSEVGPGQKTDTPSPSVQESGVSSTSSTVSSSSKKFLAPWEKGPGVVSAPEPAPVEEKAPEKVSLGIFTTTGYCSCEICSSGSNLTYIETTPRAGHTIAADITIFPIGTKLMIGDTIYTVEDIGSNITKNKIDIFYDTHEEALEHGEKQEEVFAVKEIE